MVEKNDTRRLFDWKFHIFASVVLVGGLWVFISSIPMDKELVEHGDGFVAVGQPELALQSYESALEYNPDNTEAQFQQAVVLSQLGNSSEALAILDTIDGQALERPARIELQRGWILYNQGDAESAETLFSQALEAMQQTPEIYPIEDFGSTYTAIGWATYLSKGCDAALNWFQLAVDTVPDLPTAQRGYTNCHE